MAQVATGLWSETLAAVKGLVAGSSAFQAVTGLDGTASLARVHYEMALESELTRPCAFVMLGEGNSIASADTHGTPDQRAEVGLILEAVVPESVDGDDPDDVALWAINLAWGVARDVAQAGDVDGALIAPSVELIGVSRADAMERQAAGDLVQVMMSVRHGVGG